ncbi:cytochrome b [Rhizobium calliandrae]|uniref:Cytochrome b n=1 Tax=Rhizobium calliandrae TaxID=1312182 RepID=A0ABT7KLT2_9HYPH|nr:cytochrome b [Rhizobium calliandrae]MDL2409604.1 cytochrome b [Rhizobium calliandrae]
MTDQAIAAPSTPSRNSYDSLTIILHWLTAVLVVSLLLSIELRGFLVQGTWIRSEMQPLHVSLGILLLPTILVRIFWRLSRENLSHATNGLLNIAARVIHLGLYGLLIAQVGLGFAVIWARDTAFTLFGLFPIPRLFDINPAWRSTLRDLHGTVAWVIIGIAGIHALAALFHHFVLRDEVLARMLPAIGRFDDKGM